MPVRTNATEAIDEPTERRSVKCLVWDLDHTIWSGVLIEGRGVCLRPEVTTVLRQLDERGILHSIASRNDRDLALGKLHDLGLREYFLYPQVTWGSKVSSVRSIAERLNIGLDALAFVDDEPAERAEIQYAFPQVRCFDSAHVASLPTVTDFCPRIVSPDARLRRQMYLNDLQRQAAEEVFEGSLDAFLATLQMRVTITVADGGDLARAEELTQRTNQLNSTGYTFSYAELERLRSSAGHLLLMASLEDRFGSYGKIGLALVERNVAYWTIRLLLVSCRVISRGVGTILMGYLFEAARTHNARLRADFIETGRNRLMYIAFHQAGFREVEHHVNVTSLERDLATLPLQYPPHIIIQAPPFSAV